MKNTFIILLIILLLILLFRNYDNKKEIVIEKIDSIISIKYDTIKLKEKGKIKFIKDTLIVTKPFESRLDTNIKNKIMKINYSFPENNFDITLKEKDTTNITLNNKRIKEQTNWIELILGILIGIIIGIL